jgi:hypothetical protein
MPACLPGVCIFCCLSGTVVRVGPGKYDKEAEGGRKEMVVKPGDKVGARQSTVVGGRCLPTLHARLNIITTAVHCTDVPVVPRARSVLSLWLGEGAG